MVNGSKNLDLKLGGQKPYLDKIRLGYMEEANESSSKDSQPFLHVYIASKGGHSSEKCFSRKKAKQKVKKPKTSTNTK